MTRNTFIARFPQYADGEAKMINNNRFDTRTLKATVVNSGSVGLSYDGDRRASYVVIDPSSVTIRRVEYDVEREVQELRARGYPRAEWLASILMNAEYRQPS